MGLFPGDFLGDFLGDLFFFGVAGTTGSKPAIQLVTEILAVPSAKFCLVGLNFFGEGAMLLAGIGRGY
jgi:hypothetical protein